MDMPGPVPGCAVLPFIISEAIYGDALAKVRGGYVSAEGIRLFCLSLSGNELKDEGCQLMAEAAAQLPITRKLTLHLSDNGLSVAGLPRVLSAVSASRTLEELHVSLLHKTAVFTFTPEPGGQEPTQRRAAVADSFMPHTPSELPLRSQRISLSGNALGDEGAAQLAQLLPGLGTLRSLNLSENGLSLDAVCSLSRCFSAVPWLLLLQVGFKSQHFVLRGDRGDSLQECQLDPPSLSRLCETLEKCPGPLEVKFSCRDLSEPSLETLLEHLPRLPQLSLLQLSQMDLCPKSPLLLAALFGRCPRLRKVDLRSLKHTTLQFRSSEEQGRGCCGRFTDCNLSPEHVESLCQLLSKCEDLSQLDLSANLLGDGGLRSLLRWLPQVPVSGSLDLSQNSISQEGALHLVEALPSWPRVREAALNLGSEQSFRIHFSPQEEAEKTLRLSKCNFGPEHVSRLATSLSQAQQLTELTLTSCGLDPEQLTVLLSQLTRPAGPVSLRVEEPWVERASVLDLLEVCAQALGDITEIRAPLGLGAQHKEPESQPSLPGKSRDLTGHPSLLSISMAQKQLQIQLEFPQQENPEAMALRWDPGPGAPRERLKMGLGEEGQLAHCDLGTNHSLLVLRLMETYARLRQLSLLQVNLCEASSQLLQSLLPGLCELKKFRLISSCMSSKGLAHLASGLRLCQHLEELDLSNSQRGVEDPVVLMGALEGTCRLKRLDLSHLPLGGSTLGGLAQGLSHVTHLQSLRLSGSSIGDADCCHLSEPLRAAAASLEELDLSYNQIGDAGAQHLAAVLPELLRLRKIE
ncbi:Protein NLRC5 [Galemys pyrenaicus]|uniref:Protein NLRC5 n=1 Tax=Galemys pyrenaicus TaxID=202257 RepID=A0A8J5ZYP2_GALPY|nr:Protein NLRC5 [Galemys pyrenaicus]